MWGKSHTRSRGRPRTDGAEENEKNMVLELLLRPAILLLLGVIALLTGREDA